MKEEKLMSTIILGIFTLFSGILALIFQALWKGAIGVSCTLYNIESNAYLVCIMKHIVYGSFMNIFWTLTIALLISLLVSILLNKNKYKK